MTFYQAYGLLIQSELELPEFPMVPPPEARGADLEIGWGDIIQIPKEIRDKPFAMKISESYSWFYRQDLVAFLMDGGKRVDVIPFPGVEPGYIRAYLVGLIMAMVLYQRGNLVLHASVVTDQKQAVAFMAASGGGKSSLAAALHLRGWAFCNDDVAPLRCTSAQIQVTPGFPQVKLTDESALSLGQDLDHLLPLHSAEKKRGLKMKNYHTGSSLPLGCVFVLQTGPQLQISKRLSPAQAIHELLQQTLPTRFHIQGSSTHLQNCALVASQIPFYHLQRTQDLSQLPDLADLVAHHLVHR